MNKCSNKQFWLSETTVCSVFLCSSTSSITTCSTATPQHCSLLPSVLFPATVGRSF